MASPTSLERISALSDNECSAEELTELLNEMEHDPELKHAYSRRVLVREATVGTRIARGQPSICEGVMARLATEPMAEPGPKVVDLDSRRRWLPFGRTGALAAAATVAAVAILVAMPGLRQAGDNPAAIPLTSAAAQGNTTAVSAPVTRRRDLRAVAYTPEQTEQMDELNGFLIQHSRSLADQGVGGTLRHARFAAQSQQQPQLVSTEDRR